MGRTHCAVPYVFLAGLGGFLRPHFRMRAHGSHTEFLHITMKARMGIMDCRLIDYNGYSSLAQNL